MVQLVELAEQPVFPEAPMSESEKESEVIAGPLSEAMAEHEAWLRKPLAPKYLERRLETVKWEGFTLVLFVYHSRLICSTRGHSTVVRILCRAGKRYQDRLRVVYFNRQEQRIDFPPHVDYWPTFSLYYAGKLLASYEWRGRITGKEADFWAWLQGHLGPTVMAEE
jgi:hypothetical protein